MAIFTFIFKIADSLIDSPIFEEIPRRYVQRVEQDIKRKRQV